MTRLYIGLALLAALAAGLTLFSSQRYNAGVRATVEAYEKADKEGAQNVRQTSIEVLRDLGGVDDPNGVLEATGGLRD